MREDSVRVVVTAHHPVANCIDLRQTFAGQYRFAFDEAYEAERPELRGRERAWLTCIPCKFGRILPYGGRRLAAVSAASRFRRRQLEALPGVTIVQGGGPGSVEVVVTFDVADIAGVAAVLGARRPRRLSDEERARRRAQMLALRSRRAVNPETSCLTNERSAPTGTPPLVMAGSRLPARKTTSVIGEQQ